MDIACSMAVAFRTQSLEFWPRRSCTFLMMIRWFATDETSKGSLCYHRGMQRGSWISYLHYISVLERLDPNEILIELTAEIWREAPKGVTPQCKFAKTCVSNMAGTFGPVTVYVQAGGHLCHVSMLPHNFSRPNKWLPFALRTESQIP
jgi:hypothetical protein